MASNNEVAKSCVDLLQTSIGKFRNCDSACKILFNNALADVEKETGEIARGGFCHSPEWNPSSLMADCIALESQIEQEITRLESLRTVLGTCMLFLRKTWPAGEMKNGK